MKSLQVNISIQASTCCGAVLLSRNSIFLLFQELMRQCTFRKKSSERTEQTESGNAAVNLDEEGLVTNVDEESEDAGKTKQ